MASSDLVNPQQSMPNEGKKSKKQRKAGVRKLTFLVGPKRDPLPQMDSKDWKNLKDLIVDTVKKHFPNQSSSKDDRKKDVSNEKNDDKKPCANKISEHLIIGLRSVLRKAQNSCLHGILVSDPLESHLQNTLFDVAIENRIPILFVNTLEDVKECLNLSSITCFAFKSGVEEKTSSLHSVYEAFRKIALTFKCNHHEGPSIQKSVMVDGKGSEEAEEDEKKETMDSVKSEKQEQSGSVQEPQFRFINPPFEELFVRRVKVEPLFEFSHKSLIELIDELPTPTFPNRWFLDKHEDIPDTMFSISFSEKPTVAKSSSSTAAAAATASTSKTKKKQHQLPINILCKGSSLKRKMSDFDEVESQNSKKQKQWEEKPKMKMKTQMEYKDVDVVQLTPSNKVLRRKQRKIERKKQKMMAMDTKSIGVKEGQKTNNQTLKVP